MMKPDLSERYRLLIKVPPPDLWPDIELRTPSPGRERSPRRLLAAGLAIAVATAAIGFAVYSFGVGHRGPASDSNPRPTPSDLTARVTASIPIGPRGQTPSVAYGAGSVWVA